MAAKDLYEKDFYAILGVDKKASGDEIKKKYRSLAREFHPDKTKGDDALEEKFKAVSEAYDILSDSKKRAEYDEARSLFERGGFRGPMGGQGGGGGGGDFSDLFGGGSPNDIFANLFGGGGVRRGPRKGQDLQTESTITFKEAIIGTTLELKLSLDGGKPQTITARVPAGVNDGAKIRVKGKGAPGEAGPGDLFILLHVKPHPIFSRKGENILLTLPVTFVEATLGADIKVPTLDGEEVTVRLAPGTPNGRTLRVKGRGIKKGSVIGDLLATIEVQVPQKIEGEASEALKKFAEATASHDVRMEFRAKASQ
jgi:molecular chaperone DnaJ